MQQIGRPYGTNVAESVSGSDRAPRIPVGAEAAIVRDMIVAEDLDPNTNTIRKVPSGNWEYALQLGFELGDDIVFGTYT
jgi:hypothetical protein